MATLCLTCLRNNLRVLEIGDTIVEDKDCSNCKGENFLEKVEFLKSEIVRANKFLNKSKKDSKNSVVIQFKNEKQEELDALQKESEVGK